MLKKGLFIVAAVAILAVSVQAGSYKSDKWPMTLTPVQLTTLPVKMHIGYYIAVQTQGNSIILTQISQSATNYQGCGSFKYWSNFAGTMTATIAQVSPKVVDGTYVVCFNDYCSGTGVAGATGIPIVNGGVLTTVTVCVTLTNGAIYMQVPTSSNIQVATVSIQVVPNDNGGWS